MCITQNLIVFSVLLPGVASMTLGIIGNELFLHSEWCSHIQGDGVLGIRKMMPLVPVL